MSGKVIAVANMKGGVGKTATVVGLAETLAAGGYSVLVIDTDAQANASVCIAGDQQLFDLIFQRKTIDAFIEDVLIGGEKKLTFDQYIYKHASTVTHGGAPLSVSLLAASSNLRTLERELIFELTAQKVGLDRIVNLLFALMQKQLNNSAGDYDYILIDCAPGISAVTEASIRLADMVIIPTIPDFLSTYGLQSFCANLWKTDRSHGKFKPKDVPRVLFTRRRRVKNHDEHIVLLNNESEAAAPPFKTFLTSIPETTRIAEALSMTGEYPTFTNKWGYEVVSIFNNLAAETKEALDGARH